VVIDKWTLTRAADKIKQIIFYYLMADPEFPTLTILLPEYKMPADWDLSG
jgi:hypothetical protein